ncbi:MAG: GldG family protein [Deltaproteobacteria bacterium]|nr:GldG family protein [Deltaproteobacteria bacterium]
MSDENKPGDETKNDLPQGESDESVTKIEKRKSEAPAETKPVVALADDSPTGAQTPIAKRAEEGPKSVKPTEPKVKTVVVDDTHASDAGEEPTRKVPAKKAAAKDAAEEDEDERPAVKRPAPVPRKAADGPGDGRKTRASGESVGLLVVVGAVLVVGNLAMQGAGRARIDATREERFTLSKKGTGHLLSTLTKELKIQVYAPEGLATVDAFIRDLRDLLSEYVRFGDGKVSYEIIYPDRLEGEQKQKAEADAQEAGLKKQLLGETKGAGSKSGTIGEGFLGMVLTYGGEKATMDLDERQQMGLEFFISNKIRELRDKEDKISHRIGYLQGHKEKGYQELSQVFTQFFPYYKLEGVDLSKGEKPVDETLDGLIVSSPEEEIPSKELRQIDKFLMKGKAVAIFGNNVHLKDADPSMNVTFSGMGLDKLLTGYGIDFKNELVIDKGQFWTPVLMTPQGLGLQLDPYPFMFMADASRAEVTFDNKFAPFFRLQQLAIPFPSEITVDQARAGGQTVTVQPVIRTTNQIITVQGTSVAVHPGREKMGVGATGQKEEKRQAILGVNLEGPIKSAFNGPGEGVDGVPLTATGKARLLVVSSGSFFGNAFQEAGKSPFGGMMPGMDPNMGADEELMRYAQIYNRGGARIASLLVAKQTCDWISQETDLLATGAKLTAEPELTYPKSPAPSPSPDEKIDSESFRKKKQAWIDTIKGEQRFTQWGNILFGPALIGLIGLYRWWNRGARRAAVKI